MGTWPAQLAKYAGMLWTNHLLPAGEGCRSIAQVRRKSSLWKEQMEVFHMIFFSGPLNLKLRNNDTNYNLNENIYSQVSIPQRVSVVSSPCVSTNRWDHVFFWKVWI